MQQHNNNNSNDDSDNRDNNNKNNISTPIYFLLKAFKSSFPNTKPKFEITQEVGNIIKSLKPKNTYGCHWNLF
jgi:hypothetical protein